MSKKKKFTVGEILSTRKVGSIGKNSTLQDVINEFGEPGFVRHDGFVYYGNLVFQINKINKKIASIGILNDYYLPFKPSKTIYKRLNMDIQLVMNMKIEEIKQYLKVFNIEIYTNEDEENLPVDDVKMCDNGVWSIIQMIPLINYYPKNNKYFTQLDPKFRLTYDFECSHITKIEFNYNYRSKRRY